LPEFHGYAQPRFASAKRDRGRMARGRRPLKAGERKGPTGFARAGSREEAG